MTDKKLKVNSAAYTELSIQIATLEAKVDKILQLLMKPEVTIDDFTIIGAAPGHASSFIGVMDYLENQSDDEIFLEENK